MSGSATNQNGPVGHTGNFNFRGSLAAATAGDRRRPQATAGDRRRPQASKRERSKNEQARLHGTKTPPRLIPATWGFAHERAAEMGGGEWRLSQGGSAQRRANDRGNGDFPLHATGSHGPDAIQ